MLSGCARFQQSVAALKPCSKIPYHGVLEKGGMDKKMEATLLFRIQGFVVVRTE